MKKTLPPELTTSAQILRTYHGEPLDLTIHFNVFGEILRFENDYFDLPEVAKKLTYGVNPPPEIKVLDIFSKELKILLPMLALELRGKSEVPRWLYDLECRLFSLKEKVVFQSIDEPEMYIKDAWTNALYSSNHQKEYIPLFPFFIKEKKESRFNLNNLFSNMTAFISQELRDDIRAGKEYANLYFIFFILQMVDPDAVQRITKQIDTTASELMIDISAILNKEIFMEKRLERDIIHRVLQFINVEEIKNAVTNEYSKNFEDRFKISDPVLVGMLKTYIYKVRGNADLQQTKSRMNDVFRDFYNIFKPY